MQSAFPSPGFEPRFQVLVIGTLTTDIYDLPHRSIETYSILETYSISTIHQLDYQYEDWLVKIGSER